MKACIVVAMVSLALLSPAAATAQDPVKVDPTHFKVVLENATVRVLRIDYAGGAKSNVHRHPESVVIPLVTRKVRFTMPDGKTEEPELLAESATFVPATTHSVTNLGSDRVDGILVEFKSPKPGTVPLPAARPGLQMKVLGESPRAVVQRVTTRSQECSGDNT
jgi:quercetin dioxygenase-like cupin family protein